MTNQCACGHAADDHRIIQNRAICNVSPCSCMDFQTTLSTRAKVEPLIVDGDEIANIEDGFGDPAGTYLKYKGMVWLNNEWLDDSKVRALRDWLSGVLGERSSADEPSVDLSPLERLLVEWWGSDMDDSELFNRAVRSNPALADAMQALPEKSESGAPRGEAGEQTEPAHEHRWLPAHDCGDPKCEVAGRMICATCPAVKSSPECGCKLMEINLPYLSSMMIWLRTCPTHGLSVHNQECPWREFMEKNPQATDSPFICTCGAMRTT